MAEAKELKKVRSVLQHELDEDAAAAVLFVGFDRVGDVPEEPEGWTAFARGALREALEQRVGTAEAVRVSDLAVAVLAGEADAPPSGETPTTEALTRELPRLDGPSKVLVVASGSHLARTLKGALGSRVVPMAVRDAARVRAFIDDFEPGVLVVDFTDPVPDLGPAVAEGLGPDALVVLWGRGPEPRDLADALVAAGTRATMLDRSEGVTPLLELVRGAAS